MLSDIQIRSIATDAAYERGLRYFKQGRVRELTQTDHAGRRFSAVVAGSHAYEVQIVLTEDQNEVEQYHCTCPAAIRYMGICKHVVAALKELECRQQESLEREADRLRQDALRKRGAGSGIARIPSSRGTDGAGRQLLKMFARRHDTCAAVQDPVYLVPRLFADGRAGDMRCWLEFRLGMERLYILRDVFGFVRAVENGQEWELGRHTTIQTAGLRWADRISEGIWHLMMQAHRDEESLAQGSVERTYLNTFQRSQYFEHKKFYLSASNLRAFLDLMAEERFELHVYGSEAIDVCLAKGSPAISLDVVSEEDGGNLRLETGDLVPLDNDCCLLYQDGHIYRETPETGQLIRPLLQAFWSKSLIHLNEADVSRFFGGVMPQLDDVIELHVDPAFQERYCLTPLTAELYIDYEGEGLAIRLLFSYDTLRFNPLLEQNPVQEAGRIFVRNEQEEQHLLQVLAAYGFHQKGDRLVQEDEEKSYDFLSRGLPALPDWVEVFYAELFQKRPVRPLPKITAGVSVNDANLLEVTFDMKEIDFAELLDILESYRKKKRYHRMKDRSFVTLGEQQLQSLAAFVENTGLDRQLPQTGSKVELPLSEAMYLDNLAREDESLQLVRSRRFREIVRDIRNPQDGDFDVPESLRKVLRDYQVTGFQWLSTLASYGLGGILADDMGLGKTLQVISFLLAQQDAKQPPSLVVVPTSLLYNWLEEIHHFAPALSACAVTGTKAERMAQLEQAMHSDVLVTTYNMIKRDIALYGQKRFRYVFLDEAQHIKNPATQSARAVKKLSMGSCFALTGTPIENTLTELWSIFDFLMPGYLFSHARFKQHFEVPIVRSEDKAAMQELKRRVMPFILRRMKNDVLRELPDKVERQLVGEMTPKQAKVYRAYFMKSQKTFASALGDMSSGDNRIRILAILTRLRQIACDPALFIENYDGGSGKLDLLEELVTDAVASGHRLLIFSQFTTMLSHIAVRLRRLGLAFLYLDGATPALERMNLVKKFNDGSTPLFLISLKAGGTGLNLTGADMVVHFDPWWNPAVEDQATDRAYRLGQKRNVQVVKLLMKDTVEEKIYQLQQRKKSLIDQMIRPGENFLSKLTEEEIRELFRD
ncbi:DEAD/DEAH box helicase [Mitsuokella sp.]|uniref:DEAD/DEAH box helicase n=1 Tax=Mitsuokella sp. TaxID=2049034 RepID=UPI002A822460|nr:DEAD/DEAH box helicase [Mitsuokella sp.]MDY4473916.1 DEAD/DEAH box helicase [Mitsuokella sp.]